MNKNYKIIEDYSNEGYESYHVFDEEQDIEFQINYPNDILDEEYKDILNEVYIPIPDLGALNNLLSAITGSLYSIPRNADSINIEKTKDCIKYYVDNNDYQKRGLRLYDNTIDTDRENLKKALKSKATHKTVGRFLKIFGGAVLIFSISAGALTSLINNVKKGLGIIDKKSEVDTAYAKQKTINLKRERAGHKNTSNNFLYRTKDKDGNTVDRIRNIANYEKSTTHNISTGKVAKAVGKKTVNDAVKAFKSLFTKKGDKTVLTDKGKSLSKSVGAIAAVTVFNEAGNYYSYFTFQLGEYTLVTFFNKNATSMTSELYPGYVVLVNPNTNKIVLDAVKIAGKHIE